MRGPAVVLALFAIAQVIAAATMLGLGKALQAVNPDAGWIPWTVVGVMGVAASVAFLCFSFNWQRWTRWPAR
jgi:hypothetical protein